MAPTFTAMQLLLLLLATGPVAPAAARTSAVELPDGKPYDMGPLTNMKTIFVDPAGNDAAVGTAGAPVKTFARAWELVRRRPRVPGQRIPPVCCPSDCTPCIPHPHTGPRQAHRASQDPHLARHVSARPRRAGRAALHCVPCPATMRPLFTPRCVRPAVVQCPRGCRTSRDHTRAPSLWRPGTARTPSRSKPTSTSGACGAGGCSSRRHTLPHILAGGSAGAMGCHAGFPIGLSLPIQLPLLYRHRCSLRWGLGRGPSLPCRWARQQPGWTGRWRAAAAAACEGRGHAL